MSDGSQISLLAALHPDDRQACAAWRLWRDAVDLQHLEWAEMQLLPLLHGPRLESWLMEDSAAGVLKGIVRRAWTEAQMRLGLAREVLLCLEEAGCGPAIATGGLGANLRLLRTAAIRPVLELRMLILRGHLAGAAAALEEEGWQARESLPAGAWLETWLNRMSFMLFERHGTRLYLHWRLLRVPERAVARCEAEFFSHYAEVEAIGTRFRILAPELALLEAMVDREESVDVLAWQAEAALLCRTGVDWKLWRRLAERYEPKALARVPELRAIGVELPDFLESEANGRRLGPEPFRQVWRRAAGDWARRLAAAVGRR